jgi:hypothetical protein
VHPVYCVAFWFTQGVDSFRGFFLETIVDLNLGQPKKGSKRKVKPKNGFVAGWNKMELSE